MRPAAEGNPFAALEREFIAARDSADPMEAVGRALKYEAALVEALHKARLLAGWGGWVRYLAQYIPDGAPVIFVRWPEGGE